MQKDKTNSLEPNRSSLGRGVADFFRLLQAHARNNRGHEVLGKVEGGAAEKKVAHALVGNDGQLFRLVHLRCEVKLSLLYLLVVLPPDAPEVLKDVLKDLQKALVVLQHALLKVAQLLYVL